MQYKDRLDQAEERFNDLTEKMSDPAVINDGDQYRKVSKARSALEETVGKYGEWKRVDRELRDAQRDADGDGSRSVADGAVGSGAPGAGAGAD